MNILCIYFTVKTRVEVKIKIWINHCRKNDMNAEIANKLHAKYVIAQGTIDRFPKYRIEFELSYRVFSHCYP